MKNDKLIRVKKFVVLIVLAGFVLICNNSYSQILWGITQLGGMNNYGVIFRYDVSANTYSVKVNFNDTIGSDPQGSLFQACNGKLYGLTSEGGKYGDGVLFEYDIATLTYTKKADFDGKNKGSNPKGSLIQATNGKLYGLTSRGGTNSCGVIFEYDITTDSLLKKADFNYNITGGEPNGDLMQASDGKLYGMTYGGGTSNNGVLFAYDILTDSLYKKIDFDGLNKGSSPYGSLLQASDGKLYGITSYGGSNNLGVLFEYDISTDSLTKKIDFGGTKVNCYYPQGNLIQYSDGKLYGVTTWGGANKDGAIFQYDPVADTLLLKINYIYNIEPDCGLLQTRNGDLYGMSSVDNGGIYEYDMTNDTLITKMEFTGTNGSTPQGLLIEAAMPYVRVNITASDTDVCPGTIVTFKALAFNGGQSPTYQWYVDNRQEATGDSFTYTPLNKDTVKCILTSSLTCASPNSASSNMIIMKSDTFNLSFNIETNTENVCAGVSVIFAAKNVVGGKSPIFQWKVNGKNAGTNNSFFKYFPSNNDTVVCVLSAVNTCTKSSPVTSNKIILSMQSTNSGLWGVTEYGGLNNTGTIFKYDYHSNSYTKIYDFNGQLFDDFGSFPQGSLMQASNNKLYGMTWNCVPPPPKVNYHNGVLYEYDPVKNIYNVLIGFTSDDSIDEAHSSSTLMQADNGRLYGMGQYGGGKHNCGVIFEWNLGKKQYSNLYSFDSLNGAHPYGSLIQAYSRKLYGMTESGGTNNAGVLFAYDLNSSVYKKLLDFNGVNGANPYGSLILTPDQKLYGLTESGGLNNAGVLFEYKISDSSYTKLYDFADSTGMNPFSSLMLASNGKLYGLTENGGKHNRGVIFEYDVVNNKFNNKFNFDSINGAHPDGTLMQAQNGKIYGLTKAGGAKGYGVMFEYNPADGTFNKLVDFDKVNGANPLFTGLIELHLSNLGLIITADNNPICPGTNVTFTANQTNGGTSHTFQWKVNGKNAGQNDSIFSYIPSDKDIVNCVLTSGDNCATNNPDTSNIIKMNVSALTLHVSGDTIITCGNKGSLQASVNSSGSDVITYKWTPSTGLSSDSIANPFADIKADATYKVTIKGRAGCNALSDSIKVMVIPITADAGQDQSIHCKGEVQLNANTNLSIGENISSGTENWLTSSYFTDANTGYICGDSGTVLKTVDGGINWIKMNTGTKSTLYSIYFLKGNYSNTGFAAGDNTIMKTTDSGINWTTFESKLTIDSYMKSIFFIDSKTGYAVGASDYDGIYGLILKTTNSGTTWESINGLTCEGLYTVFFTSTNIGYAGGNGSFIKTTNSGKEWFPLNKDNVWGDDYNSIIFTDSMTGYVVGSLQFVNPFILKTEDAGINWTQIYGLYSKCSTINSIMFTDKNNGYAVCDRGEFIVTNDGGNHWIATDMNTYNSLYSVSAINGNSGIIVGENGTIFKFPNEYKIKWTPNQNLNSDSILNPIASPTSTTSYKMILTGPAGCGSVKDSVKVIVTQLSAWTGGYDLKITCNQTAQLGVYTNYYTNEILRFKWSPSADLNFDTIQTPISSTQKTQVYRVTVTSNECPGAIVDSQKVTVVSPDYKLDFSTDTLTHLYPYFTAKFYNSTPTLNSYNFTWNFGDSVSVASNDSSLFHTYKHNGVYAVTLIGVNKLTGCSDTLSKKDYITCSGLIDNIATIKPNDNVFIHTCYPNPFNFATVIKYNLPEKADVNIKIYDKLGNEVANILSETEQKGSHSIELNGTNLTEGIYYYRIQADKNTGIGKIVLIK